MWWWRRRFLKKKPGKEKKGEEDMKKSFSVAAGGRGRRTVTHVVKSTGTQERDQDLPNGETNGTSSLNTQF